jgi:3-O-methylgallate 3,4-dioxygenase
MLDRVIPSVPIFINTFYPPNQPPASRCAALGSALRRGIESWPSDLRVAVLASGGLTHFVINEEVDRQILDAIRTGDLTEVKALGEPIYQSGTSEVKNWLPLMQAMSDIGFKPNVVDYIPCYRSPAGTGCSMGFAYWQA